uniref:Uncharacterized protein n=1 Tax=Anguilla anguilla TaxID=7936 RepID=A0A0E9X168_ANGAN
MNLKRFKFALNVHEKCQGKNKFLCCVFWNHNQVHKTLFNYFIPFHMRTILTGNCYMQTAEKILP